MGRCFPFACFTPSSGTPEVTQTQRIEQLTMDSIDSSHAVVESIPITTHRENRPPRTTMRRQEVATMRRQEVPEVPDQSMTQPAILNVEAGMTEALKDIGDEFMKTGPDRQVIMLKKIGAGGFGLVYLAVLRDKQDMEAFALKQLKTPTTFKLPVDDKTIRQHLPVEEAAIQTILVHQNVVRTYWADICVLDPYTDQPLNMSAQQIIMDKSKNSMIDVGDQLSATARHLSSVKLQLRIAMEYCCLGSLKDYLASVGALPVDNMAHQALWKKLCKNGLSCDLCCAMTALDVAKGLLYMHKSHILHADLKPHNILLAADRQDPKGFVAKLSDFGLSAHMRTGTDRVDIENGTVAYLPAEAFQNREATRKTDVYAFGLIMWEIWHGDFWFSVYERERTRRRVSIRDMFDFRPICSSKCPAAYSSLLMACLNADASSRPGFLGDNGIVRALERLVNELRTPLNSK